MTEKKKPADEPAESDRYVTLAYVATMLDVDRSTVRKMISREDLPAVKIGTRKPRALKDTRVIRVRLSDVSALLDPIVKWRE